MSEDGLARLSRNAAHNLSALLLPTFLSLVSTPFIVHRLGDERFGLYVLTLSLVGFGGLLDLGLNTAAVKFVAEEHARGDMRALSGVVNSLLVSRVFLGSFTSVVGLAAAPFLCTRLLAVAPRLVSDAVFLVRVASVSVGVGMIVGTLASLPRAAHRFDITSRITLFASATLTLTTVAIVAAGRGIRTIALAELAVTSLQLAAYWVVCRRLFPDWRFRLLLEGGWLRKLLGFGSLAALGSLTSVVFVHANRILVGRFLGTAAVTYFAVPWSITGRLSQFVYAMAEVLAPLASSLTVTGAAEQLERLHRRVSKVVLLLAGTVAIPLVLTAPDVLGLWMGPAFGERGGDVLRLLTVAAVLQSLAMVAYLMLTGMGRPAAANIPAVEGAVLNIVLAVLVGPRLGLAGIAGAVLAGVALQAFLLEWRLGHVFSRSSLATPETRQVGLAAVGALVVGIAASAIVTGPWVRLIGLSLLGVLSFHGFLWAIGAYTPSERDMLLRQIRSALPGTKATGAPAAAGRHADDASGRRSAR